VKHVLRSITSPLDVGAVDDNTLAPFVAHDASDLFGALLTDEGSDHVQGTVDAGQHARRGQDAKSTEAQLGALEHALATGVAHLQADGTLASGTRAAPTVGTLLDRARRGTLRHAALLAVLLLGQQVRVFILILAKIEAQVIDDVTGVDDIGAVGQVTLRSVAADDLELGHVVRVRGGRKAGEHACITQDQRAGAHAEQGALAGRVFLLLLGKGFDEAHRLRLGLEHLLGAAADNDQNVDLVQAAHGVCVAEMGLDGGALGAGDVLIAASEDGAESFGFWGRTDMSAQPKPCESRDVRISLTRVTPVVLGPGEDLEGAGHVTQVKLVLNGNEDLDGLEVERIRLLNDCTW